MFLDGWRLAALYRGFLVLYRKLIHGLRSVTRGGNAVAVGQLRRHRFVGDIHRFWRNFIGSQK